MSERKYRGCGVEKLERLAEGWWDSSDDLKLIAHELNFRSKARAHRLQRRVVLRISELSSVAGGDHGSRQSEEALFARVGLHPNAPAFVIRAARKAYKKHNHPDTYVAASANEQDAAQERFKEIENIFEEIESIRASWADG